MFRLNNYAGLPVVASGNENRQRISEATRKGCPPGIPRSIRSWFQRKTPTIVGFFRVKINLIMLQLTTIFFLIAFSLLAVIHYLALQLYLYWRLEWFDIPMHLFGGAVVALGIFTLKDLRIIPKTWLSLRFVLLLVLLVAGVWELFELYTGIPIDNSYYFDTALDIIMGLAGGYVGYIVGKSLHRL